MRVMHVLTGPIGGANVGALELIRTSREQASGIEHFVVYPGVSDMVDRSLQVLCSGVAVVPMSFWHIRRELSHVRRAVVRIREIQYSRWGHETRKRLNELINKWRIDLVHTNNGAILDGALVARDAGLPHVWHVRERIGKTGYLNFDMDDRSLVERIGNLAHTIVAMSNYVAEIFVGHGQAKKTRVVYDGVDPALFDTDSVRLSGKQLRSLFGVPDQALLIGKVAAVTAAGKRHEIFVRAAGKLARHDRSLYFTVIGILPTTRRWLWRQGTEYFESLRRLVRQEGIEDRFIWMNHVQDAGAAMNAIDILAHACDIEGFGRVAIEAMMAGKPVVGPAAGGFTESVMDGVTGFLVEPGNHNALADALQALVENRDLRNRFGTEGRERAASQFSPTDHLQKMIDIYACALQGKSSYEYDGHVPACLH